MKRFYFLILFFFIITSISAQRFEGGLLGGFNATQVKGDIYQGYHKPGVLVGAFVQADIAPAIFSGIEIKYSQKGSRNKIDPKNPEPEKYIMRLGYVEVPFFVGFRANDRSSIIGGISAGYLVHGKEYNENGLYVEEDQAPFNTLDIQPFLGFQFDMLDNIKLDLRLAFSILPIREHPGENATTSYWLNNQFNNVISLAFYYRFDR
jgi:hypothetical protein